MNIKLLLRDLSTVDERIWELKDSLGDLPQKIEKQQVNIQEIDSSNSSSISTMDEINQKLQLFNGNLDDAEVKIEKYKGQLHQVRNNKEYDALNLEIDHMQNAISQIKEEISTLDQKKEKVESQIKVNNEKLDTLKAEFEKTKAILEKSEMNNKDEMSTLRKKREKILASQGDKKFIDQYNRIIKMNKGVGISKVESHACSNCYIQLPPQIIEEVKEAEEIICCPDCDVFLYWEDEE